jgi:hypothetical protein
MLWRAVATHVQYHPYYDAEELPADNVELTGPLGAPEVLRPLRDCINPSPLIPLSLVRALTYSISPVFVTSFQPRQKLTRSRYLDVGYVKDMGLNTTKYGGYYSC